MNTLLAMICGALLGVSLWEILYRRTLRKFTDSAKIIDMMTEHAVVEKGKSLTVTFRGFSKQDITIPADNVTFGKEFIFPVTTPN